MKQHAVFFILLIALSAQADSFETAFTLGIRDGGDQILDTGSSNVNVDGFFTVGLGGVWHMPIGTDLQLTYAYQRDSEQGYSTQGNRLELMQYHITENSNRFGLGYTRVISSEISTPSQHITYDGANGFIIEYDWKLKAGGRSFIGIRYTHILLNNNETATQLSDGSLKNEIDASGYGLEFINYF